jgi:hypothetical protein
VTLLRILQFVVSMQLGRHTEITRIFLKMFARHMSSVRETNTDSSDLLFWYHSLDVKEHCRVVLS